LVPTVFDHLVKPSLAGIQKILGPIGFGIERTPSDTADTKLVKVAVGPAHCGLDRQVQAIETDIEWHLDAAQNRGLTVIEG
jgi:hypothetical protein